MGLSRPDHYVLRLAWLLAVFATSVLAMFIVVSVLDGATGQAATADIVSAWHDRPALAASMEDASPGNLAPRRSVAEGAGDCTGDLATASIPAPSDLACEPLVLDPALDPAVPSCTYCIGLTWQDNSCNETSFIVERSRDGVSWGAIATVPKNSTSYRDCSVECSTSYYYRVIAYRVDDSQYSDPSNVTFCTTAPCAPTDLVVECISSRQINVCWQDNSPDNDDFHLERRTDTGPWHPITVTTTTCYTDTDVEPGKTYEYRVRAHRHDDDLFSCYSDEDACTVPTPTPTPTATPTPTPTPTPTKTPTPTPTPTNTSTPTPTPTPTNTPTRTPTPTNTATRTPTSTPTPTPAPCRDVICNSSFETDDCWIDPPGCLSQISTYLAHTGNRSWILGIPTWATDRYCDAWVYQIVTIPAAVSRATLYFWYWPYSEDTIRYDWMEVQVWDASNLNLLATLWKVNENRRDWARSPDIDLTAYAGRTISLRFNVHNDGVGNMRTFMYVDDVSIETCPGPPPPPPQCRDAMGNGGFEATRYWAMGNTPRPAGYTTAQAHFGSRSMRLGIEPPTSDAYSHSSAYQAVVVPANATGARLSFWYKSFTEDVTWLNGDAFDWEGYRPERYIFGEGSRESQAPEDLSWEQYDWQEALILDASYNPLATVFRKNSNSGVWTYQEFDLTAHRGRTINVYFNVFNNGQGGRRTRMYVDDVVLEICGGDATTQPPDDIIGRVLLQGRSDHSGVSVCTDGLCTTTDQEGRFTLVVPTGTYNITARKEGYLSARREGVQAVAGEVIALPEVTLLGGDADGNERVDLFDLTIVGSAFGTAPPGDERADINDDGRVDLFDLVMVATNFGASGPAVWPSGLTGTEARPGSRVPQPGLSITPARLELRPGEAGTLELKLTGAEGIYAADVRLQFDPAWLEAVDADLEQAGLQIEPGDLFGPDASFEVQNWADSRSGEIRYAVTRLPGVAGGGGDVLARITFRSIGEGAGRVMVTGLLLMDDRAQEVPVHRESNTAVAGPLYRVYIPRVAK